VQYQTVKKKKKSFLNLQTPEFSNDLIETRE